MACGTAAFDALRIESGTPLFGVDFDEENLPQEVGRDELAISFTKGCYLGQETVARIDALGHVNQQLAGVRFAGPDVPDAKAELTQGGTSGRTRNFGRILPAARRAAGARHGPPPMARPGHAIWNPPPGRAKSSTCRCMRAVELTAREAIGRRRSFRRSSSHSTARPSTSASAGTCPIGDQRHVSALRSQSCASRSSHRRREIQPAQLRDSGRRTSCTSFVLSHALERNELALLGLVEQPVAMRPTQLAARIEVVGRVAAKIDARRPVGAEADHDCSPAGSPAGASSTRSTSAVASRSKSSRSDSSRAMQASIARVQLEARASGPSHSSQLEIWQPSATLRRPLQNQPSCCVSRFFRAHAVRFRGAACDTMRRASDRPRDAWKSHPIPDSA